MSLKVSLRWGRGEGDPAGKKPDRKVAMGDVRVEVDAQHGDPSSVVPRMGMVVDLSRVPF